jgi:C1A family cysteine protease
MPVRILVFVVVLVGFINPLFAQTPVEAPRDSAFTKYIQERSDGKWRATTESGHGLGYIPSPVRFNTQVPARPPLRKVAYPSSYDLRTQGKVTSVKDQGGCGSCWAFATMGSVESRWLVSGYGTYDLSENNLKECHGFVWDGCDGGNEEMATAYLSRDSGPVAESADPYVDSDVSCTPGVTPVAYETDAYFLPKDANTIKDFILNYGGVYTTMYYGNTYYNASNYSYYCRHTKDINHAVLIAGWDDSKLTAAGTGAWIIKNSWGTSWGENGYFYVSYSDKNILSYNAFWPDRIGYDPDAAIYQYDYLGADSKAGYGYTYGYGLVKFVASANLQIDKLATWVVSSNSTVDFYIYDDFNGTTLSTPLGSLTGQSCPYAGYYTFELPQRINVNSGNDFYIKVRYSTSNSGEGYPVPIETAIDGYSAPTIETGKCWVSLDGSSWMPIGGSTGYAWDLCIRAYTTPNTLADIKVFLQGPYSGSSMSTGLNAILPTSHPYGGSPWNYNGSESVASGFFASHTDIVDWILVQLRTGTDAGSKVAARACFLKSDGSVVDLNGTSQVTFGVPAGNYYIVVRHRNHLAVMSAAAVALPGSYNFTISQDAAYSSDYGLYPPMKDLGNGKFGMYAGDVNGDGTVYYLGPGNDRGALLVGIGGSVNGTASGYISQDANLDGSAYYLGPGNDRGIILVAIGGTVNGRVYSGLPEVIKP